MNNDYREVKQLKVTTNDELEKVTPNPKGILVAIKSWPSQTTGGILVPDQYVMIRAEKYICEVIGVGSEVVLVEKGDVVVVSMYSGHHIVTKTGHAKIVHEGDILNYKKTSGMELRPETYLPGIDYILIKIFTPKDIISDAGIVVPAHKLTNDHSKQDVSTRTAEVLAVGSLTEESKYAFVTVGTKIIFDAYVGLDLPVEDITDEFSYKIMYIWDILATVKD